ncbi:HIT family protein [Candidatus Sneabacter namystus]|uniref:HIT domain-containing protein n=1 Tax=Candidatus Sneabacter namystus TaxID=2601646 RepID=A0A5C0UHX5_9RICK|nr:HIT domain-containing protein [Candidatus Sneabacter namystus]QEK39656.1 HIT domain-containing protein [Candidatus Sneabacter namystus]
MCNIFNCLFFELKENLILKKTDNFLVISDPYPITDEHIMIISKKHYGCIGELDKQQLHELSEIFKDLKSEYLNRHDDFVFYEHGRAGTCGIKMANQECHHLHLHILPIASYVTLNINKDLNRNSATLDAIPDLYNSHGQYLLLGRASQCNFMPVYNTQIPSHYLRSVICHAIGSPEKSNWQTIAEHQNLMQDSNQHIRYRA